MVDLHAWLLEEIGKREQIAQDHQQPSPIWEYDDLAREVRDAVNSGTVAFVPRRGTGEHIALNDPSVVLRRCAADRKLIADITAERHLVVEDCWYTCAAATEERDNGETCDDERRGNPCDCGRDTRVERRLRIIAEGYGWTESSDG
ncbi:DUF6221 family protein [Streptomyces sp. NEAU-174]|uniref:DUF6221 family protein n=1 Tax=Streptomyces sp. NEAU-174 TaxID=3458254 RepID=UPI0040447159